MKGSEPIIIVGAGPVGLFTAQQLVAAGRKVVVLETLPEPAPSPETRSSACRRAITGATGKRIPANGKPSGVICKRR